MCETPANLRLSFKQSSGSQVHVYLDRMSSNVSVSAVLVSDAAQDRFSSLCAVWEFIRSALLTLSASLGN